jgi:hypothetical protein
MYVHLQETMDLSKISGPRQNSFWVMKASDPRMTELSLAALPIPDGNAAAKLLEDHMMSMDEETFLALEKSAIEALNLASQKHKQKIEEIKLVVPRQKSNENLRGWKGARH